MHSAVLSHTSKLQNFSVFKFKVDKYVFVPYEYRSIANEFSSGRTTLPFPHVTFFRLFLFVREHPQSEKKSLPTFEIKGQRRQQPSSSCIPNASRHEMNSMKHTSRYPVRIFSTCVLKALHKICQTQQFQILGKSRVHPRNFCKANQENSLFIQAHIPHQRNILSILPPDLSNFPSQLQQYPS